MPCCAGDPINPHTIGTVCRIIRLCRLLNLHIDHVRPGRETQLVDDHTYLRDGFSQIGGKLNHAFSEDHKIQFHLFTPIDLANLKIQDSYDHNLDTPQVEIFWSIPMGEIQAGHLFGPYYNAIASTTDRFSSYYTGFATFSPLRVERTIAYYSPEFYGFSLGASISNKYVGDDLITASLTWKNESTTLSLAHQDQQGPQNTRVWGVALSHQFNDAIFLGITTEVFDSDVQGGFGNDGDQSTAAFASYDVGKHTFKGMLADTDNFGEMIYTLGWDYRYSETVKFYAEYYFEQETVTLTRARAGSEVFDSSISGGSALAIGVALYFEWRNHIGA